MHESGESKEISGYGHGVDPQDKGAGKATTYALKYALLYTFLVPTGSIDDADKTHSDNIAVSHEIVQPKKRLPKAALTSTNLESLKSVGKMYTVTTEEQEIINKRIKELEDGAVK